jgi:hypothetical protein
MYSTTTGDNTINYWTYTGDLEGATQQV